MQQNNLVLHRGKEMVGTIAWITWALALLISNSSADDFAPLCFFVAWIFTAAWVALDVRCRRGPCFVWTILTLLTGPIGLVFYYLARPPMSPVCPRCGSAMTSGAAPCPTCGRMTIRSAAADLVSSLAESLVHSRQPERAKETTKHLLFALAAMAVVGFLSAMAQSLARELRLFLNLMAAVSAAAYWVLLAWWVYLDAAWRRMEGVPWAVLTLLTNVVGLVTYLVVRYPDPKSCPKCGSSLPSGLKHCPFCGSEAEWTCPHCQSPIKPGWQFCPSCAARLAPSDADGPVQETRLANSLVTINGSIVDAEGGNPIAGAVVQIDSLEDRKSATTDRLGRFELSGLEQRPYVFVASAEGYASQAKAYPSGREAGRLSFALRRLVGSG